MVPQRRQVLTVRSVHMSEQKHPDHPDHPPHPVPDPATVLITVDSKEFRVHRGRILVIDLKKLAGVPAAYEIVEVVEKKLIPMADDGFTVIQGGERFLSHPRDGQSS